MEQNSETASLLPQEEGYEAPNNDLRRELKSRHLNMIVIGGTIGTGLFLGSGQTLATAGPGGSLVAFLLIGSLVYSVVSSLGEMVCLLPVPGSFNTFGTRFVEPALGFTMGWNYWVQWSLSLPSELSALAIVLSRFLFYNLRRILVARL